MKNLLTLIAVVLFSQISFANRLVGNGGGFGEMKAIAVFQKMNRYISVCLTGQNLCELKDNEIKALAQVFEFHIKEKAEGGIRFFVDPSLSEIVRTNPQAGALIYINSHALTDSQGVAKPASHIGHLVLAALLQHAAVKADESFVLAAQVFMQFIERTKTVTLTAKLDFPYFVHWVRLQKGSLIFEELIFESPEKSYDLLALLEPRQVCATGLENKINNLHTAGMNEQIVLDLQWRCQGSASGRGTAVFAFPFQADGRLKFEDIKASLRGVIRP